MSRFAEPLTHRRLAVVAGVGVRMVADRTAHQGGALTES
jgi:hypothetical protein